MKISVDSYLSRSFHETDYNCFHFTRDVWLDLTGVDLGDQIPAIRSISTFTDKTLAVAQTLKKLDRPTDPCLVLMLRKRTIPHIGVLYKNKVLHLSRIGAVYTSVENATNSFPIVEYYQ